MNEQIPPPENVSPVPDEATRRGLSDYTSEAADNRVLRLNLGFLKYGTSDQTHAAAIVLSMFLLLCMAGVLIFNINTETGWRAFQWLGSAFLFVAGVAVGRSTSSGSKD